MFNGSSGTTANRCMNGSSGTTANRSTNVIIIMANSIKESK